MEQKNLDLAIIGAGPAALSAALYAARAGLSVRAYERANFGGELAQISEITNYPGFTGTGAELAKIMRDQAKAVGAEFSYGECQRIKKTGEQFELVVDEETVMAKYVLVATGAIPKELKFKLEVPVSYCALCDSEFAKGKHIAVIGGANSAVQEAIYLAPLVKDLTLITHSKLKADPYLQEKLRKFDNVSILEDIEPTADMLNNFDRVFVAIGRVPATKFLHNLQKKKLLNRGVKVGRIELLKLEFVRELDLLDSEGYVITGGKKRQAHETVIKGLYVAGDARSGMPKQVITAAGDGAAAAIEIVVDLHSR